MSKNEILELMKLRGWSRARLAAELDLSENIVYRWVISCDRVPGGPASILMRMWLEESRKGKKSRKEKQPA